MISELAALRLEPLFLTMEQYCHVARCRPDNAASHAELNGIHVLNLTKLHGGKNRKKATYRVRASDVAAALGITRAELYDRLNAPKSAFPRIGKRQLAAIRKAAANG